MSASDSERGAAGGRLAHLTDLLATRAGLRTGSPSVSDVDDDGSASDAGHSLALAPYRGNGMLRRVGSASALMSAMPSRRKATAAPPAPRLSSRHLEQGLRLASDALEETRSSLGAPSDYARASSECAPRSLKGTVDCYWSSLDYLCGAFSTPVESAAANGTLKLDTARATALRGRLLRVLEKVDVAAGATVTDTDGNSIVHASTNADGRIDITSTCASCHSRVKVRVPPQWLPERGADGSDAPRTWEELMVGAVVEFASALKRSPLPTLISAFFAWCWATVVMLDHQHHLRQRALLLFSSSMATMIEIDRELGIARRLAELVRILYEAAIRGLLAYARAEGPESGVAESNATAALRASRPRTPSPAHSRASSAAESHGDLRLPGDDEHDVTPIASPLPSERVGADRGGWAASLRLRRNAPGSPA